MRVHRFTTVSQEFCKLVFKPLVASNWPWPTILVSFVGFFAPFPERLNSTALSLHTFPDNRDSLSRGGMGFAELLVHSLPYIIDFLKLVQL